MPESMNPVTFSGETPKGVKLEGLGFTISGFKDRSEKEPVNITVGRLGVPPKQRSDGKVQEGNVRTKKQVEVENVVCVVVWNPDDQEKPLASIVIDEEHLVRGLQLLFPNQELEV